MPTLLAMLDGHGLKRADILSRLRGAPEPAELDKPVLVAPIDQIENVVAGLANHLDRPSLGWDLGWKEVPKGAYGSMEFCIRSARNLREALALLPELMPLVNPYLVEYSEDAEGGRIAISEPDGRTSHHPHLGEYQVAVFIRFYSEAVGAALPLRSVGLAHHRATSKAVAGALACPCVFDAPANSFTVTAESLDTPLVLGDAALHAHLRSTLISPERVAPSPFLIKLEDFLDQAAPESMSVDSAADWMGISVRTLQRRLDDEGLSYSQVRNAVLKQRAHRLLTQSNITIKDVARELGFRTASSFARAVQRWFGESPGAIRRGR